jgi:DNA-binding beta-propeller fold protein YncE
MVLSVTEVLGSRYVSLTVGTDDSRGGAGQDGRKGARRERVLTALGGVGSAGLALLAIFTALSDPERWAIGFAIAAAAAWLAMWIVHWYGHERSFWAVLTCVVVMSVAALWIELADSPAPAVADWRRTHTPQMVDAIPLGERPRAAAAHDGQVWVVGLKAENNRGVLWRIDSGNLGPAAREFPSFAARNPFDIAVNDEAVWVTDGSRLIKIDHQGEEVWRHRFGDGGENEVDVGFGKVWFKETSTGKIYTVDPRSGTRLRPPVRIGPEAVAIAVGVGSVWISSSDREGEPVVVRLDSDGRVLGAIDVLDDPQDLVAGNRAVYVAHSNERLVTRIDPRAGAFGEEIPGPRELRGIPPFGGIDAGGGTVWVALAGSDKVFAISECNFRTIGWKRSGESPYDVAVLGGRAYMPNFHSGNLSVFRLKRKPLCTAGATPGAAG